MSNLISYDAILKSRNDFRTAGTTHSSDFNLFDYPSQKFFKLFFYFNNGNVDNDTGITDNVGLLAPTWLIATADSPKMYYKFNSAWSYFKMNDEDDRAELLIQFVNLLSNISSESPWYFTEISGLDSAMDRKAINSDNFTIDSTRPKISIKCLPDAFDDRIGTLLDLYRAISWDWITKREILPANLRKFDMGILIYETPTIPFHVKPKTILGVEYDREYAKIGDHDNSGVNDISVSYKYIELHNCEFDYNSSKNFISNLNNTEGFQPEYVIDINFDDCYEVRYNEFLMKEFGDLVKNNSNMSAFKELKMKEDLDERTNFFNKGFLENSINQLSALAGSVATGFLKQAVLGNLYTFSLTRIGDQLKTLASGDLISTARNIDNYLDVNKRNEKRVDSTNIFNEPRRKPTNTTGENAGGNYNHNIFDEKSQKPTNTAGENHTHNIFGEEKRIIKRRRYLGNIFTQKPFKPHKNHLSHLFDKKQLDDKNKRAMKNTIADNI